MKIGVDLRALQIGHQYRGIGEVVKRTLNTIFDLAVKDSREIEFIFYEYDDDEDPKKHLVIPAELVYREISVGKRPLKDKNRSLFKKMKDKGDILFGSPISDTQQCDVFLQYDYSLGVPKDTKTILIKHDLIPLIFWQDFFTSPWVHVRNKAARTTIRTWFHNYEFKRVLKRSVRRANKIICVSEHTKQDLIKYLHASPKKMKVIPLGVDTEPLKSTKKPVSKSKMPSKKYLLFIGAADPKRRAIDDLVAVFNNLKADGNDIQLALAGENFQTQEGIPNEQVREAVRLSSYKEDILTLGYIDDTAKNELYKNAVAFVFPTHYEGFGIPILEAMINECPVITYKNSSIPEVGGKYALYAHDWIDIWKQADKLLNLSKEEREKLVRKAKEYATTFSWETTGKKLYEQITNL